MKFWLLLLLCTSLFASPAALKICAETLNSPFPAEEETALAELIRVNHRLASEPWTTARLWQEGILKAGAKEVFRPDYRREPKGPPQILPFQQILLPFAHSGYLAPTKIGDLKLYSGLFVLMPGIGTQVSNALSVCDIAQTFNKGTKYGLDIAKEDPAFRLLSFPFDVTLNGMAEGAPEIFSTPEGQVAMLRHVILILKIQYPNLPVILGGRSQGGLIAAAYAQYYDDILEAFALNPSHPDPVQVRESIKISESDPDNIFEGVSIIFDRTWQFYGRHTSKFDIFGGSSQSHVTLLLTHDDASYLKGYEESYLRWAQEENRQAFVFEVEKPTLRHNLWNRQLQGTYEQVIGVMAHIIKEKIDRSRGINP